VASGCARSNINYALTRPKQHATPAFAKESSMPAEGFDHGIIVADDSGLIRDNVRSALGPPWRIFVAANGIEALQYASSMHAVLVLLYVRMPQMDGLTACARIRQLPHYATTPIVMLTAYDDEDMRRRAQQAGATKLLRKPFTIDRLRADLAPLLAGNLAAAASGPVGRTGRPSERDPIRANEFTRDQEVLGVCRDAEAVVDPRRYVDAAEVVAASRALPRR